MKYINTLKKYNKMIVKENQRLYKIYSSLLAESEEVEELEDETIVDSKEVCKEDTTSREDKITDEFLTRVFGESEECEDAVDCKKVEESSDSENVTITISDWVSDDEDTPEPDEEFFRNLEKKYGVKIDILTLNGVNNMPEVNITGKEVDLKKIIADEYLVTDDQEVIDDFYQDSIVSEIQEEVELETESEKVCEKEDGDWISAKDFFKMEESEEIDIEDEEIDETIEESSDSENVTITISDWVSDDEDTPEPDEEFFRNLEKKYGVKIDILTLNGVNNMPEVNITGKEVDLKKIIADEYLVTDDQEVIDDFYQDSIVSEIQEEAVDANEFFNV